MPDCRMRGPAKSWPEQTAGGPRGAPPPGLGVRGLPPGYSAWLTEDMLKASTRSGGMAERVK
jgi:hypothetical protein